MGLPNSDGGNGRRRVIVGHIDADDELIIKKPTVDRWTQLKPEVTRAGNPARKASKLLVVDRGTDTRAPGRRKSLSTNTTEDQDGIPPTSAIQPTIRFM